MLADTTVCAVPCRFTHPIATKPPPPGGTGTLTVVQSSAPTNTAMRTILRCEVILPSASSHAAAPPLISKSLFLFAASSLSPHYIHSNCYFQCLTLLFPSFTIQMPSFKVVVLLCNVRYSRVKIVERLCQERSTELQIILVKGIHCY